MAYGRRGAAGAALVAAVLAGTALTGCSGDDGGDEDTPAQSVSDAASAVESAASGIGDLWASATAEAGRQLDEITEGVDVKDDVRLGTPATDDDGRTTVGITVRNTADSEKSFAVQVDFTDPDGGFVDAVVVNVPDVPAGKTATATARSTHDLPAGSTAKTARAVRY
ncbi:hypothetical protein [Streptomyces sp. NPDC006997]|uniref:hypothetical protein n=1 Tax=Streptomyces sp. NPDC006997 TaxID=3155356 RepID=UPI0033F82154